MTPTADNPLARPASLLATLKTANRLPSPPGVALRVLELCRRDESELHEIADAVMSDPALAARLLRYANSPLLGGRRRISSVLEAVLMLGLRATKLTALGFSLPLRDFQPRCEGFLLPAFWAESFLVGVLARRVAAAQLGVGREDAFTAGLLAGIGRLVMATGVPEAYASVLRTGPAGGGQRERERVLLGADHAALGARVLRDWQLPETLCDAIEYQYEPQAAPPHASALASAIQRAAELAGWLATLLRSEAGGVEQAGATGDPRLNGFAPTEILADVRQMAGIFDIQLDDTQRCLDLLAEARDEAARVGLLADVESLRAARTQRELLVRATHDPLTGLMNRAAFEERLEAAVRGLARDQGHFALLLIDLDGFKQINDTRGHQAGDEALRRAASAIRESLRDVDVAARYGGDEFVVLLAQADLGSAAHVAERVCSAVRAASESADPSERLTASIGVAATARQPHLPTARGLLTEADAQMYVAKRSGGDTWASVGAQHSAPHCDERAVRR